MKNQQLLDLKAYKVDMSRGAPMKCDADELPNVILAIKTGAPCKIRSGVFNPSYYVSITEDTERIAEVQRENGTIRQHNEHVERTGGKEYQKYKGMQPLKDIFEGITLSAGNKRQLPTEQKDELPRAEKPGKQKEIGEYRAVGR